ncbi:MAG: right-handed parallel beta-helix repeat-containing protein, partial [Myxococcales bacterium]|nr:right-handed parallel beta-helix repeat-containing protein [Myxococcales bacterium]
MRHPRILILSLALGALGALATTMAAPRRAAADTTIAGGNVINQTWTAANGPYHLQGDVTVPAGAFLTIEAGTVVEAAASTDGQASGLHTGRIELTVQGTLDVTGTAAAPVTFRDASTSSGTWYGIVVDSTAAAVTIDHAEIRDAIHGVTNLAAGGVLSLADVTVTEASSYGLYLRAGSPTLARVQLIGNGSAGVYVTDGAAPTLTDGVVRNNGGYGVYFAPSSGARTLTLTRCTLNANGTYGV